MSSGLFADQLHQLIFGRIEAETVHILQGKKNHREFSEISITQRLIFSDGQTPKQCGISAGFKEAAEHTHVQRFSETARPRKKTDHAAGFQQLLDQGCFIDIKIILSANGLKAFDTHRQPQGSFHGEAPP